MINYLIKFDWSQEEIKLGKISIGLNNIEYLVNKSLRILSVFILMYISIKIGNYLIKKFVERQIKSNTMLSLDSQRAKTLGEVMKSVLKYSVYFIGVASIISTLFNGLSFTFASMGGLAVGFGAQSLIKDLINGFFILFEDQFGVGDHITVGTFSGLVESIGIRTTIIKDFTGDIHSIPNGSIIEVTNHSRGNIRFIVDVDIAYEENIDNAISIIKEVCSDFEQNNEDIREPMEVLGVNALNASSVTIRVIGKSKPLKQWEMERELRKLIKLRLDKEGIEIPYPKTQLVSANMEKGDL
ncbi:mechanosensitive ion channel family protein [Clostridium botulinum]|uniref:Mechanosensitive ion channel family protein n=1 Tax=Clostridium botulinum TaxID=1491 RepID=A0A6B4PC83_CLOBO|nr:mechanosensitive ion channel family protein [Clostridium botulinum]EES49179.1 mechanosensitive ion channel family protein [Clostridium botulinum E1 str. 'BoNT E Beluga']MBY6762714.1 mechanosensitive ion channel family protein [Clostridium botulinum]MBY6921499.1 mechanosensitive ion channel family protein [Clostridium botulinum]MCR1132392.1 mechanosensitive ion channel family protein [Clostridium botulinum]NFH70034.1 mechanosensitive ion channel family protein [Clostridium botulinum]